MFLWKLIHLLEKEKSRKRFRSISQVSLRGHIQPWVQMANCNGFLLNISCASHLDSVSHVSIHARSIAAVIAECFHMSPILVPSFTSPFICCCCYCPVRSSWLLQHWRSWSAFECSRGHWVLRTCQRPRTHRWLRFRCAGRGAARWSGTALFELLIIHSCVFLRSSCQVVD